MEVSARAPLERRELLRCVKVQLTPMGVFNLWAKNALRLDSAYRKWLIFEEVLHVEFWMLVPSLQEVYVLYTLELLARFDGGAVTC